VKNFKSRCLKAELMALSLMAFCGSAIAADNIVEVADKAGTFKTLLSAAKAAGLVHTLQEDGPFTVFAPTDDAFAKLPKQTLNYLLRPENKEKLATILKYHVISGKVAAKDAVRVESAKSLSGDSVRISIRDGRLAVNDANVIVNDVEASNGIRWDWLMTPTHHFSPSSRVRVSFGAGFSSGVAQAMSRTADSEATPRARVMVAPPGRILSRPSGRR